MPTSLLTLAFAVWLFFSPVSAKAGEIETQGAAKPCSELSAEVAYLDPYGDSARRPFDEHEAEVFEYGVRG